MLTFWWMTSTRSIRMDHVFGNCSQKALLKDMLKELKADTHVYLICP